MKERQTLASFSIRGTNSSHRIEALEDRQIVEETNTEDPEAEIDQTVYDLFDLNKNEREVIGNYLEVF